jgi:hypothetical protein
MFTVPCEIDKAPVRRKPDSFLAHKSEKVENQKHEMGGSFLYGVMFRSHTFVGFGWRVL